MTTIGSVTKEQAEAFLRANPFLSLVVPCIVGMKMMAMPTKSRFSTFEKHAGPWRGKGSFGHGFGPQLKR